jgi:single-strand DNA-binding protein
MNYVVLVGRLVNNIEVLGDDIKHCEFTLAVTRQYKNTEGIYETDFIDIKTFNNIATSMGEYCRKGDLIGIKGVIQTNTYEDENGIKRKATFIKAEKVTFLSCAHKESEYDYNE